MHSGCFCATKNCIFCWNVSVSYYRWSDVFLTFSCWNRIKFYTQEIVLFRQDLLYRMRRSCLIPPSTEETSDPFEHVRSVFIFLILDFFWHHRSLKLRVLILFLAACCDDNTSEPSLPPSFDRSTHYLELWSQSTPLSNPAYGTFLFLVYIEFVKTAVSLKFIFLHQPMFYDRHIYVPI